MQFLIGKMLSVLQLKGATHVGRPSGGTLIDELKETGFTDRWIELDEMAGLSTGWEN